MLRKKDLKKSPNLKKTFSLINQHLYGRLKYTDTDTRARSKEVINLLLCKLVDEKEKAPEEHVDFCIKNGEAKHDVARRMSSFFQKHVKQAFKDVMGANEEITLNDDLLYMIVKELQDISLLASSKDIFRDAFEIFVSRIIKEEGGQFFTSSNIITFMVDYLDPEIDSVILDPACGHGGFLLELKDRLWAKIQASDKPKQQEKQLEIISNLYGIDKDLFLSKICKLYLEILSGGKSKIFCEDALDLERYNAHTKEDIKDNQFDIILTNPPFGAKIPIDERSILRHYELGHVWMNVGNTTYERKGKLAKKQPPQILFIERCIQLLKNGGKMGIILPEGLFGNPTDRYIWEYIESKGRVLGIISLDQNAFQPYTCNKTSIMFFQKLEDVPEDYDIDFAIVENIGHDKDGKTLYKLNKDGTKILDKNKRPIINDDLIHLNERIKKSESFNYLKNQLVFKIKHKQIKNKIYIPNYYIGVEKTLKQLENDTRFVLYSIRDLIQKGVFKSKKSGRLPRGDEIGSKKYGLGDIPFIRTSDIYNWEINLDSHKKTSEEVYEQYKYRQQLEVGDILLVKDGGPNLIGNTAYITELDTKVIIQSHIYKIKVIENEEAIDPFLILYLLNLDIVQKQIEAITFVQGTIASIGNRVLDVILPFPSEKTKRIEISNHIKQIIDQKTENRKKIKNLSLEYFFQ